jgi:hypothetical protein
MHFTQADTIVPNATDSASYDRYAYANSNPIKYIDPNGHWIETALDIAFIAYDIYDICANGLNWENGLSLTADAVGAVIPIASGLGLGVRALFHAGKTVDKVTDTIRVIDKIDDTVDIIKHGDDVVVNISRANDVVDTTRRITIDTYKRPSSFREGIRDKVWETAKDADGLVRDPQTGLVMDKSASWDMGHKPGFEFSKHR